jgi:O-glycosyl hydrolase
MRRTRALATTGLAAIALTVGVIAVPTAPAKAASAATINGATTFQTITGFGASEAFGEASTVMNASSSVQQQVLKLLYSPSGGAGLTILRNEISADSGSTIEPNAPSSPTATPTYLPLSSINSDQGQLWFAQQIKSLYGVTNVFADAWTAPAFMKVNNSTSGGTALCGLTGATCSSGNWVQAYANYLKQYAADYSAAGDPLTYIGPENEANLSTSYDSMQLTPAQTAQLLDTLGPTMAGTGTAVECCATEGWDYAQQYAAAIEGDSTANADTAVFTSHGYTQAPTTALSGWSKPAWETEWSTFESFDSAWDDNTDASGLTWAQHIFAGLDQSNLAAFLYWWGSTTPSENGDNEGLLEINGSTVTPTGRLWAFGNFSDFVRPGAVRIGATTSDGNLTLDAFKNTNGNISVVALNTGTSSDTVNYSLSGTGIADGATVTPYLTNASSNIAAQATTSVSGSAFTGTIPARSLVTYVITPCTSGCTTSPPPTTAPPTTTPPTTTPPTTAPPTTPPPSSSCQVVYTTQSQWTGGFVAQVNVTNTGTTAINGWTLKFTFPGDQKITNAWNAAPAQSGEAVTLTNMSYNAALAAGASTSLGFQGTWTNSDAAPTAFTLNGATCST